MQNVFSVSEISKAIIGTLNKTFGNVRVKGEVTDFKRQSSGHVYFGLKDEGAVLKAVCWRGVAAKIPFNIENGAEVIVEGEISGYQGSSHYQIIAKSIEVSGVGALMELLEKRKKMLAEEGLFDVSRKKPLPFLPKIIGIITSPTGAVIRDILHRLEDRFGVHVILYPVKVQGAGAAEEVAEAVKYFNQNNEIPKPDLLIIARGGGSIEDLWCFNEEVVVRAVAASKIPTISAIGHETDVTLIDFVADKRAPTPTAAAEMAVPVRADLLGFTYDLKRRLFASINRSLEDKNNILAATIRGLLSPIQILENKIQRVDELSERLNLAMKNTLNNKSEKLEKTKLNPNLINNLVRNFEQKLSSLQSLLFSYNHKNVLARGFSLVTDLDGNLIKSANSLTAGKDINIELFDGKKSAKITSNSTKKQNLQPDLFG